MAHVKLADMLTAQSNSIVTTNNGTSGRTYTGVLENTRYPVYNKEYEDLRLKMIKHQFAGETALAEQAALDMSKIEMDWEYKFILDHPISMLKGTSSKEIDGQIKHTFMENVGEIWIKESLEKKGAFILERGENGELKLTLSKCILEIKQARFNYKGEMVEPKKAYLTDISAKDFAAIMSIVGRDELKKKRQAANYI